MFIAAGVSLKANPNDEGKAKRILFCLFKKRAFSTQVPRGFNYTLLERRNSETILIAVRKTKHI